MSFNSSGTNGAIRTSTDVALSNPTDSQILSYNGSLSKWQNQTLSATGAQALAATPLKTANYTATAGDLVPVDATTGALTITLPTTPTDKSRIVIKKIDSSANIVTIAAGGSDVLNKTGGSTSVTLSLQNQSISLQYATAVGIWYVVGDDLPLTQLDSRYQPGAQIAVQYVSLTGSDSNNGNSWGSAKATIAAALATIGSTNPGTVYLAPTASAAGGAGYPVAAQALNWNQSIIGCGPNQTYINVNGTGDGILWGSNAGPGGAANAGTVGAGTISGVVFQPGTGTASTTALLHIVDSVCLTIKDTFFVNSPGTGLWFEAPNYYSERIQLNRVQIVKNAIGIRFSGASTYGPQFGYERFIDVRMNINPNQIGIQIEGALQIYGIYFSLIANVSGSTGNTAAVLNMLGTSQFSGEILWTAEQTSGTGASLFQLAAGTTVQISGTIRDPSAGAALTNNISSSAIYSAYAPIMNMASQSGAVSVDALSSYKGMDIGKPVIISLGLTGNVTSTTILNLMAGQTFTLIYRQDSTGGRTIVPPTNVLWANGVAPTWSTAGSYRDAVTFVVGGGGAQTGQLQLIEISRSMALH